MTDRPLIERLRRWARGHSREGRYSPVGVAFHWTMAALIVFQLWWGWRTARLPVGGDKLAAYELHFQVGLVILILALLRMVWRLAIPGPVNDADKPGWQSSAAHLTHYVFYFLFLVLPLTGWAMLSATGREMPVRAFGTPWPHMPFGELSRPLQWRIEDWAGEVHSLMALGLVGLVLVHVGAALKHYFWDRDDVLPGMTPGLEPPDEAGSEAR